MAILPGKRLGPYEVLAAIGAGGMGEVYQAHDTKLGRDVAIKVLPEAVADDVERLSRFQREAKMLAALNHPNIATIYGLEQSGSTSYLVMELVSGETLAERIRRERAIPFEEALAIARQIAEALEAAHEKGIVHRDLKPANVKVTPEGKVKVLDFGLAKAFEGEAAGEDLSNSPTLSMAGTLQGAILGTAGYMAPEQARGKRVDKRADIWAFGVLLYEMLTGKRAFHGEDIGETLAAVIVKAPDFSIVPAQVRPLLQRCLEKNPKKRLRDIGDMEFLLAEAPAAAATSASWRGSAAAIKVSWGLVALLAVVVLGLSVVHFRVTPSAAPVMHLSVPLPPNSRLSFVALSPDGRRLVLGLFSEGKSQLWLRSLNSPQLEALAGTDNARGPFWSPDGKSIGFFVDGKLKTMPATGGPPQVLCDGTGQAAEGTWNRDGVILFSTSGVGEPIRRVSAAGGECIAVTKPEGESRHRFPKFLPDDKHFTYLVREGDEAKRGLYVAALDNPTARRILADDSSAIFASSTTGKKYGFLLFLRGSDLMAQPFKAETLQPAGEVFRVASEVSTNANIELSASVSAGGILVYEANFVLTYQLAWLDRSGKELGRIGDMQDERGVSLSPDANSAATGRRNAGIWIYDLQRGGETRFTLPTLEANAPVWSPDGRWIAYTAGKALYIQDATGGSKGEMLLENEDDKYPSDWSRDGRYLIYTEIDPKGQGDIWYLQDPLSKSNDHKPVKFQGTDAVESQAQLSPDGRWLAYTSNESGEYQIYVRPFPSGFGRWKVSGSGVSCREPRWRRDGKELFYTEARLPTMRVMAVAVRSAPGSEFQAGVPERLFEFHRIPTVATFNYFLYSPSADGQRFLVHLQPNEGMPTLSVITNWEKAASANK